MAPRTRPEPFRPRSDLSLDAPPEPGGGFLADRVGHGVSPVPCARRIDVTEQGSSGVVGCQRQIRGWVGRQAACSSARGDDRQCDDGHAKLPNDGRLRSPGTATVPPHGRSRPETGMHHPLASMGAGDRPPSQGGTDRCCLRRSRWRYSRSTTSPVPRLTPPPGCPPHNTQVPSAATRAMPEGPAAGPSQPQRSAGTHRHGAGGRAAAQAARRGRSLRGKSQPRGCSCMTPCAEDRATAGGHDGDANGPGTRGRERPVEPGLPASGTRRLSRGRGSFGGAGGTLRGLRRAPGK